MITPTVGRRVWYWVYINQKQPYDAGIACVNSNNNINISFADHNGLMLSAVSVYLWDGEGTRPMLPFCEWMPYQRQQAEKASG